MVEFGLSVLLNYCVNNTKRVPKINAYKLTKPIKNNAKLLP